MIPMQQSGNALPFSRRFVVAYRLKSSCRVRLNVVRRNLASLAFLASAAAAVPAATAQVDTKTLSADPNAVAVQEIRVPAQGLRDEAAMVLVGTALIAMAAAVRRAA